MTQKELLFFTNHLATLLNAGISLPDALNMMDHGTNKKACLWLNKIIKHLQQGESFSNSLEKSNSSFDKYYCGLVEIGEKTGQLSSSFRHLATSLENQAKLQSKIQNALTYPIAVISVVLLVILGMLIWVIPTFENVFQQLHAELPLPTQIVLNFSRMMTEYYLYFLLFFTLISSTLIAMWRLSVAFQKIMDHLFIHLPLISHLLRLSYISKWCSMVNTLQKSGVPLLETIRLTAHCSNQWVIHRISVNAHHHLSHGHSIYLALTLADPKNILFDKTTLQILHIGESSGRLSQMLTFLVDNSEKELDRMISNVMELLEPILISFLGLMVGAMVIALYLPLFKIGEIT
jgi:type II secretory pathway component PulF